MAVRARNLSDAALGYPLRAASPLAAVWLFFSVSSLVHIAAPLKKETLAHRAPRPPPRVCARYTICGGRGGNAPHGPNEAASRESAGEYGLTTEHSSRVVVVVLVVVFPTRNKNIIYVYALRLVTLTAFLIKAPRLVHGFS